MYSFVTCLKSLTIDHAYLSRRRAVPTPDRDTSNKVAAGGELFGLARMLPHVLSDLEVLCRSESACSPPFNSFFCCFSKIRSSPFVSAVLSRFRDFVSRLLIA